MFSIFSRFALWLKKVLHICSHLNYKKRGFTDERPPKKKGVKVILTPERETEKILPREGRSIDMPEKKTIERPQVGPPEISSEEELLQHKQLQEKLGGKVDERKKERKICPYCGKKFINQDYLNKHIYSGHKEIKEYNA